jgi:hypothetical protein
MGARSLKPSHAATRKQIVARKIILEAFSSSLSRSDPQAPFVTEAQWYEPLPRWRDIGGPRRPPICAAKRACFGTREGAEVHR